MKPELIILNYGTTMKKESARILAVESMAQKKTANVNYN